MVPGYNVKITPRQLDEAEAKAGGKPTKLIRALICVYFDYETLAHSSALGSRKNPGLDSEVISACISKFVIVTDFNLFIYSVYSIEYVQSHHTVARSCLIDAINDKCAQCRRPKPTPK